MTEGKGKGIMIIEVEGKTIMTFSEQFNYYIDLLRVKHKEVSKASGLSEATISRYASGKREPSYGSKGVEDLAKGLAQLGEIKDVSLPSIEEMMEAFNVTIQDGLKVEYEVFLENLNQLVHALQIKKRELAHGIHHDASHVSKILLGRRKPGSVGIFIHEVSQYLTHYVMNHNRLDVVSKLFEVPEEKISKSPILQDHILTWLGPNGSVVDESIPNLLTEINEFHLEDYRKRIHEEKQKDFLTIPLPPMRKEYMGKEELMQSQLDFIKSTILSKGMEDCIMYSDIPLEKMGINSGFRNRYMMGMAMMLRKGLRMHVIHDVNRPFQEMMLGIQGWLPLYMTGQISSYYLSSLPSDTFHYFLKVSGSSALEGNAIVGNQESGKYVLYRTKEDVEHYRKRAEQLLHKANPLMHIYKEDKKKEYLQVVDQIWSDGDRKMIISRIPVYLLKEKMLEKILDRANLSSSKQKELLKYYAKMKKNWENRLKENKIHLIIPQLSDEEYKESPIELSFANRFMEGNVSLTQKEYERWVKEMQKLEKEYPGLKVDENPFLIFRNINILILENKQVLVSKEKHPTIHFVIHHEKMVEAFKNFIPRIEEE